MKRIQIPSIGKRLLSALIDLAIIAGLTCFFYFCVFSKAISAIHNYNNLNTLIKDEQVKSKLYTSDGKLITVSYPNAGEEKLEPVVKSFYVDYLGSKDKSKYTNYWYCTHILFLDDVLKTYEKETISKPKLILYEWDEGSSTSYHKKTGEEYSQSTYDSFYQSCYGTAVTTLNNSDPIKGYIFTMNIGTIRAVIYSSLVATIIPCLVVPLLTKNGKTVGKIITKLVVLTDEGYENKKYKYIFRYLAFYFIEVFGAAVTVCLTLILSSCLVLFSKKKRALHDFIAFTVVADETKSVWFKDENEELEYKEKLDKLKQKEKEKVNI